MPRHEMIDVMRGLGLKGMAGAFDDAVTTGVQRKRTAMEILTDLLRAEGAHRHVASIRYRMTAAKLPVVKDLDGTADGSELFGKVVIVLLGCNDGHSPAPAAFGSLDEDFLSVLGHVYGNQHGTSRRRGELRHGR